MLLMTLSALLEEAGCLTPQSLSLAAMTSGMSLLFVHIDAVHKFPPNLS